MNVTRWVHCMNVLFDKLMGLCYATLDGTNLKDIENCHKMKKVI